MNPTDPQLSLDSLAADSGAADTSLRNTTFVVVDLETTGLSPANCHIIEIGAVKTRGGEELGRFHTLVDPGVPLPAVITKITHITENDLIGAPQIATALADFLQFARGAVLVAHNAKFDISFLRAACTDTGLRWPEPTVLDTLALARRVIAPSEARSYRLGELARLIGTEVTPNHRALDDAAATAEVLYELIARLGTADVSTLDELTAYSPKVDPKVRAKAHLADDLSDGPGVYIFRGARNEALYIGTAVNIRRRVRSYFTQSEKRTRMHQMVLLTERVETVPCVHGFDAEVREAKLIAAHRPPYNRRSTEPNRGWWIVPPVGQAGPKVARSPGIAAGAGRSLGPFRNRTDADVIFQALQLTTDSYDATIGHLLGLASGADPIERIIAHITDLAAHSRFKRAAMLRDATATLIEVVSRFHRLTSLARLAQLQAAAPDGNGGWNLAVIRYGRLAGAGHSPRGAGAAHMASLVEASAATVIDEGGPFHGANQDELVTIAKWLGRDGVRIGPVDGTWSEPLIAGRHTAWAAQARAATGK